MGDSTSPVLQHVLSLDIPLSDDQTFHRFRPHAQLLELLMSRAHHSWAEWKGSHAGQEPGSHMIHPHLASICQANTTKDPKYPKKSKKCLALHLHLLVRSIGSASCTVQSKDPIFIILEATSCCRWNRAG